MPNRSFTQNKSDWIATESHDPPAKPRLSASGCGLVASPTHWHRQETYGSVSVIQKLNGLRKREKKKTQVFPHATDKLKPCTNRRSARFPRLLSASNSPAEPNPSNLKILAAANQLVHLTQIRPAKTIYSSNDSGVFQMQGKMPP